MHNVYKIRAFQTNRLVASCDEIKKQVESGSGLGLLYIMDRGDGQAQIGIAGSYRTNPAEALAEARKLVSTLSMMADAKILSKAIS